MTTGTVLRDQGIEKVLAADAAPHRGYADLCREILDELIGSGMPFDAEDLRHRLRQRYPRAVAHSPNVLPAVMAGAARARRIEPVAITHAVRSTRHGARLMVWRATSGEVLP